MEWNPKLPLWDFAEVEQNSELHMTSLVASSGGLGIRSSGRDCSVDLKLGGSGDFRSPASRGSQPTMSMAVSSSGPSKRARPQSNASQIASCSVDGCTSDLSISREYHRRHKVCEAHSKTPIVMVGGQEQRFCQQCSRFHLLVEFDEVKRSCRKRLDGHNRRRRKSQPESVNSARLFPNHQGRKCSVYPHGLLAPIQELNWAGIIQPEDMLYSNHSPLHVGDEQPFSGSFCSYRKGRQLPFIQDDATAFGITTMAQSTCLQPLLKNIPPSAESSSKILCDRIQQVHSDCALSLLSSSTQNPGIGLSQMLPAGRIPMHQSLLSSLPYGNLGLHSSSQASSYVSPVSFSCSGVQNEQVGMVLACGADTDLHCQSVFRVPEGSSEGASQTFPYCWQ
ncbi:unnamed protein product [Musa textilis]